VVAQGSSYKILLQIRIQVILVTSQQEGVNNNSSINHLVNNYQIKLICIDDFIALVESELDNVFIALNVGEIKDLYPIEQFGFDEFWNNSGAL
jgi:hypothetical protein